MTNAIFPLHHWLHNFRGIRIHHQSKCNFLFTFDLMDTMLLSSLNHLFPLRRLTHMPMEMGNGEDYDFAKSQEQRNLKPAGRALARNGSPAVAAHMTRG